MTQTLSMDGKSIEYTVRVSPRAKRYRIVVSLDGVQVVLPRGADAQQAPALLQKHAAWVLQNLAKLEKQRKKLPDLTLPLDFVLYHGVPVQVKIEASGPGQRAGLQLNANVLTVAVPGGKKPAALKALRAWLLDRSGEELEACVRRRAAQMGLRPARMTLRDQRTRWGSCTSQGALSFNWRLVMAPPETLDYVVVHELAHMVQANHSAAFWQVVARYCPDFKQQRDWLKKNGTLMTPHLLPRRR